MRPQTARRRDRSSKPILAAAWVLLASAAAAQDGRLDRTRQALHELAHQYARAQPLGRANLTHTVPLLLGEAALADLAKAKPADRAQVLDYVYERCLWTRLAISRNVSRGRAVPAVPPAPRLAELTLAPGGWRHGEALVLPVAIAAGRRAGRWLRGFSAQGEFARFVPALAGAVPGAEDKNEVFRLHQSDPTTRRVGWQRPAGGFLRDGGGERPPALIRLEHPKVREAIARATARAIAAWPKGPRPLYHSLGGGWFYVDYSEHSAQRFIAWLKQRHGSLRAVNAVWDTQYRQFEAAMMPPPGEAAASASQWHDWMAFNQWRLAEHVKWAVGNVRRAAPGARLGLVMTRYLLAGSHGLSGVEPATLASHLDVVEANGAGPMATDLCAAFARGTRPLVDAAMGPGPFGVLPHFLHGCAAVRVELWPLTTLAAARDAERAFREALAVRRLAPAIRALAKAPASITLLYSEASLREPPPWAVRCSETPYTRRLTAAYTAARGLVSGCGFVTGGDLVKKRVAKGRVLVVAGSPCENDRVARALVDHIEVGGHVVILAGSLLADERGHEADYLMRLGIEVLETKRPKYTVKPRPDRGGALDELVAADVPTAQIAPTAKGPLAALRRPLRGVGVRQTIRVNVVHEAWATFPGGEPAIVTFPRGDGWITYLAMPLVPQDLAPVLAAALQRAKAAEPLVRLAAADAAGVWGVECRAVRSGKRLLACAWNTTARPKRFSLHTRTAAQATNLSTGERLALRRSAKRVVVEAMELAPFETVIVEFALP